MDLDGYKADIWEDQLSPTPTDIPQHQYPHLLIYDLQRESTQRVDSAHGTSDFSSLQWSGSDGAILPSVGDNHPNNSVTASPRQIPGHSYGLSLSSAADPSANCNNDVIPLHCRIDNLDPQIVNPNTISATHSPYGQNGTYPDHAINVTERLPATHLERNGMDSVDLDNTRLKAQATSSSGSQYRHQRRHQQHLSGGHHKNHKINVSSGNRPMVPSDVAEDKKKRLNNNLGEFTHGVDAPLLLPHLRQSLRDNQYSKLQSMIRRGEDSLTINQSLFTDLKRSPKWWLALENGLEECGYTRLLNILLRPS